MKNKSLILLSGGLDSLVSLAVAKDKYNVDTAIIFDYGQKSLKNELSASERISKFYNLKLKRINLNWLKEFSTSALTSEKEIPILNTKELDDKEAAQKNANSVWVPNRNALFINIAASYAEANAYKYIIIGANKEEGKTFKDNSIKFIKAINKSLANSTNNNIQVIAPLIKMNKREIVKTGSIHNCPFELLFSCYSSGEKHCGKCESCLRLKRALELNNRHDIINILFE